MPWAIANASFQQQQDNPGVTEIVEMKGRGHALVVDSGWREVAETALTFVHASPRKGLLRCRSGHSVAPPERPQTADKGGSHAH